MYQVCLCLVCCNGRQLLFQLVRHMFYLLYANRTVSNVSENSLNIYKLITLRSLYASSHEQPLCQVELKRVCQSFVDLFFR
uniref:Uncharacterized protein n=1 Tax=Arundo donax TaxID=35708 RepID=A0A0A9HF32_ARUDO